MGSVVKARSMRRFALAFVIAVFLVILAAISDDDPEGLLVGPQHLEQVLELERQAAAGK